MKVSELREALNGLPDDAEVMIWATAPFTSIGAHPRMPIESIARGFDWNAGRVFIHPKEALYTGMEWLKLKADAYDMIVGWHMDESEKTKAVFRKLVGNIIGSFRKKLNP